MKTYVVNLIGGPGTGKSTLCAALFAGLKIAGINAEMATEYVKDLVWEESFKKITNQLYIFSKQHNRLFHLHNKVRIIITDSSLLNSIVYYQGDNPFFKDMVLWEFNKMDNINYYINREFEYQSEGRYQNIDEALLIDKGFLDLLSDNSIPYESIRPGVSSVDFLIEDLIHKIQKDEKDILIST